jgi:hypothetical protein
MCASKVAGVQAADLGGDGRDVDRPSRVHGDQRADGVTHTRDEMLPLASRNPNDGRGGQGPFEMADLQRHSLEDDKEDRREYRYQADDPEGHRIRRLTRFNAADTVLLLRLEVPRVMTAQYQRTHRKR